MQYLLLSTPIHKTILITTQYTLHIMFIPQEQAKGTSFQVI